MNNIAKIAFMKIILASSSPNRQEMFRIAQIPFEVLVTDVDEKSITEIDLEKKALAIAKLKAEKAVSLVKEEAIIITADGFNVYEGEVFEKPKSIKEAKDMLRFSSGKMGIFYTGLIMINTKTSQRLEKLITTKYWFRNFSETEIDKYVHQIDVTKYAAAFTPMNSPAVSFITKIEGSLSAFTHSAPMEIIVPQLIQWGAF